MRDPTRADGELFAADGSRRRCTVEYISTLPWRLRLEHDDFGIAEVTDDDFFGCLVQGSAAQSWKSTPGVW